MAIKERIIKLLEQLNTGIYEKEEIMALALLSSIAGESIFLLGPPGVAKSLIARRLKYAYDKKATKFEYLMSRFSTPDEIFGPVSISKLKDEDKYERITKNYLPEAWVVFLDEIWKAGPSILNALLTILNEKIFRNGENVIDPVPMKALISASNELPAKEQRKEEGLEALWDRFLIRLVVGNIQEQEKFDEMIITPPILFKKEIVCKDPITDSEYKEWSNKINDITIPKNILNVIHVIREKIKLHNENNKDNVENQIYISDRRWQKIVRLMCTSAFMNDRKEVDIMDCFLIRHCIWNEDKQIDTVWQLVSSTIEERGYTLPLDLSVIEEKLKKLDDEVNIENNKKIVKDYDAPEVQNIRQNEYYCVMTEKVPDVDIKLDDYIMKSDIDKLQKGEGSIKTNRYRKDNWSYNGFEEFEIYLKKSNKENGVLVSDDDNSWEEIVFKSTKKQRQESTTPNKATTKDWNKRIQLIRLNTGEFKLKIESHKTNDMKGIYDNIFVDKSFAIYVENNLNELKKQIELLEVEADRIQNAYTKIEPANKTTALLEQ